MTPTDHLVPQQRPAPSIHWVKKLGQWHLAYPGDSSTACGVPMLGNNYASVISENDRKKCPYCHFDQ